jgi:hypothetical protein
MLFTGWCITTIIVNGSIFKGFRNYLIVKSPFFGKLVSCIICLGLWVGAILQGSLLLTGTISPILGGQAYWVNYLILPFIQSGFGVLIESFVIFLVKGSSRGDI